MQGRGGYGAEPRAHSRHGTESFSSSDLKPNKNIVVRIPTAFPIDFQRIDFPRHRSVNFFFIPPDHHVRFFSSKAQDWKALELPPPEPRPETEPLVEDADGNGAGWSASFGRRQAEISLLQNLGGWADLGHMDANLWKRGQEPQKTGSPTGEEFGSFVFLATNFWVKPRVVADGNFSNTPRRWKVALWLDGVASQA